MTLEVCEYCGEKYDSDSGGTRILKMVLVNVRIVKNLSSLKAKISVALNANVITSTKPPKI